jgi:hypothetical protein
MALLAALLLAVVLVGLVILGPRRAGTPAYAPPLAIATPEADPFRSRFRPLVERAASAATALVTLGESRERNLLRIRAAQTEMNAALDAADAWLATHPVPAADEPAVAAYREGASSIRAAMAEALAGFLHFDFDRVAQATQAMESGAEMIDEAAEALGSQHADATPTHAGDAVMPSDPSPRATEQGGETAGQH